METEPDKFRVPRFGSSLLWIWLYFNTYLGSFISNACIWEILTHKPLEFTHDFRKQSLHIKTSSFIKRQWLIRCPKEALQELQNICILACDITTSGSTYNVSFSDVLSVQGYNAFREQFRLLDESWAIVNVILYTLHNNFSITNLENNGRRRSVQIG